MSTPEGAAVSVSPVRPRILIVDDEPDSAETMALLLSRMGADVETARDGEEAVDAAVRFGPQIVLLDIGLPKMNGYEAASHIRERLAGRPLTLVALTGWGGDDDVRRAREAGFDHHLVKPIDPAALGRLLTGPVAADDARAGDAARGGAPSGLPTARASRLEGLSHEIRTPLNTLLGAAHLLLESGLDPGQRELVQAVRRSSEALRAIVDGLIDLESIEAGTFVLEAVPFEPASLVADCIVAAGHGAADRRAEQAFSVEPSVPVVLVGDPGRIRRVVLEFMDRALRSAGAESLSVTVSSRPSGDARVEIHVCVRGAPTGAPSPADVDVGPPAFGAPGPPDSGDVRPGVGAMLCERMGGRSWFVRDADGGLSSHLTFVAAQAPAEELRDRRARSAPPLRVLVADDDPVSRRLAVHLLAALDLAADTATNGRQALAAVSRTRYDAVLLDAQMPGMECADVIREIRRVAAPSHGPSVIAMSASVAPLDRLDLAAAGADACLTKPLTVDAVRGAIAVVRAASAGGAAVRPTLDSGVVDGLRAKRESGGSDILDKLIGLFLADTPAQLQRLREAARRGDAGAVEIVAHRLRGSSATIGAAQLMAIASDVEARAQRGGVAAAAAAIEALEGSWLVTRAALESARRATS